LSTSRRRIAPLLAALLVLALAAVACSAGGKSGAPPDAAAAPALSPAAATALIEWRRPAALPGVSASPAALAASAGPAVAPGPAAAAATGPTLAPRERVAIDLGGLWVGPDDPRDGPRRHYVFERRRRTEDLAQFVRDYAPFRVLERENGAAGGGGAPAAGGLAGGGGVKSGDGLAGRDQASELVFHGRGAAQASAAERRMIGEWTRAVAVEAVSDAGSPSSYGLAFAWHRGAATGGVCDDVVVYLTGEVRAGACGAGADVSGRLAGERLQRLYAWIDGLAAFQDAGEQELRAGALLDRLIFAGRGRQRATPGDVAAIETFAGALHRELTATAPAQAAEGEAASRIAAAAVPKTAPLPPREAAADAETAGDAEATASSPPAEAAHPARPPRRLEAAVPDEPDEAPPPPEAVSPPPPPAEAVSPPPARQPPRKRPADAAAPAPGTSPAPAAKAVSPPPRQPPRKRPADAPPPPPPGASSPPPAAHAATGAAS
jgi:hypothetical protein